MLRELAPALTDEMKQLQAERPAIFGKGKWTALADHLLTKLGEEHMDGGRSSTASRASRFARGHPGRPGACGGRAEEQRILSDANSVFIGEVLRPRVSSALAAVATNFGEWEPYAREDHDDHATHNDDILRVAPYQPRDRTPRCPRCPENLCKGAVLDAWRAELRPRKSSTSATRSALAPRPRLRATGRSQPERLPLQGSSARHEGRREASPTRARGLLGGRRGTRAGAPGGG